MKTILMTTFEVGHIASGYDMTIGTLDGDRYNVRGPSLDSTAGDNPDNLPRVTLGFDQFRTIATGGTAIGYVENTPKEDDWITQVAVRLATLEEYRQLLAQSHAWFEAHRLPIPPTPTDAEILPLITPIVL